MIPSFSFSNVLRAFIQHFEQEVTLLEKSANAAHEAATHEEAKAEDMHDTRAIEASYLAAGQSKRIAEIKKTIHELKGYLDAPPSRSRHVQLGNIFILKQDQKLLYHLFARTGGGATVTVEGIRISIVTPFSPLGQELSQSAAGETISVETKSGMQEYELVSVG